VYAASTVIISTTVAEVVVGIEEDTAARVLVGVEETTPPQPSWRLEEPLLQSLQ
jgi:hypothetical protein